MKNVPRASPVSQSSTSNSREIGQSGVAPDRHDLHRELNNRSSSFIAGSTDLEGRTTPLVDGPTDLDSGRNYFSALVNL